MGLYSIRSNLNRSYYLNVDGGQDTNERNVQIYADSSRRFRIRWEFNTAYTSISPTFSNTKVLDVYGGEDASRYNTNVQIYPYSRGGNQTWEFYTQYDDKHASPNALGISAVVWKNNAYKEFTTPYVDPNTSDWGYHYINKISVDTWKKILLPVPALEDALAKAITTEAKETALIKYGNFTRNEVSKIGANILADIISTYLSWIINTAYYNNAVSAMNQNGYDGIKAHSFTVRSGGLNPTYDTYTNYTATTFSNNLVSGMSSDGRFVEYK